MHLNFHRNFESFIIWSKIKFNIQKKMFDKIINYFENSVTQNMNKIWLSIYNELSTCYYWFKKNWSNSFENVIFVFKLTHQKQMAYLFFYVKNESWTKALINSFKLKVWQWIESIECELFRLMRKNSIFPEWKSISAHCTI